MIGKKLLKNNEFRKNYETVTKFFGVKVGKSEGVDKETLRDFGIDLDKL